MAVKALGRYTKKDIDFANAVEGCIKRVGKKPIDFVNLIGKTKPLYYRRLKKPEDFTAKEIRALIRMANLPVEDVINFLYEGVEVEVKK